MKLFCIHNIIDLSPFQFLRLTVIFLVKCLPYAHFGCGWPINGSIFGCPMLSAARLRLVILLSWNVAMPLLLSLLLLLLFFI